MCEKATVEDVPSDISRYGVLSLAEDGPQRFGCQELHVNYYRPEFTLEL